ncbi:MAG: hypothetical protein M3161_06705, partial [Actinomycetota bacterium]|nr:hypothetical protein [Actinomycetota bacterium]
MATAGTRTTIGTDYGRIAGAAGIVSGVLLILLVILTFAGGAPPALDDPAQDVISYYQDNEGLSKLGGILGFIALLTVPVWFIGIYNALRDRGTATTGGVGTTAAADGVAWPRLGLVALIVTGALVAVQGSAALALGLGATDEFQGAPAVAGALFDLYNALGAAIAITFGLFLLAIGVALQRSGGYPNWWASLLYVGALASFISFFAPFFEADALAYFGLIPILILAVFALAS